MSEDVNLCVAVFCKRIINYASTVVNKPGKCSVTSQVLVLTRVWV